MIKVHPAVTLAVAVIALAGCSDSEGKTPSAHESLSVGARVPFSIWTHCGVRFTTIDGIYWEAGRAEANPSGGYPEYLRGTLTRVSEQRAVFTGKTIPVRFVYHPAPDAKFYCQ